MNNGTVALLAMLSVMLGCMILVVVQLGVIAFRLGDLKAYTMTQISHLQRIEKNEPPMVITRAQPKRR